MVLERRAAMRGGGERSSRWLDGRNTRGDARHGGAEGGGGASCAAVRCGRGRSGYSGRGSGRAVRRGVHGAAAGGRR